MRTELALPPPHPPQAPSLPLATGAGRSVSLRKTAQTMCTPHLEPMTLSLSYKLILLNHERDNCRHPDLFSLQEKVHSPARPQVTTHPGRDRDAVLASSTLSTVKFSHQVLTECLSHPQAWAAGGDVSLHRQTGPCHVKLLPRGPVQALPS